MWLQPAATRLVQAVASQCGTSAGAGGDAGQAAEQAAALNNADMSTSCALQHSIPPCCADQPLPTNMPCTTRCRQRSLLCIYMQANGPEKMVFEVLVPKCHLLLVPVCKQACSLNLIFHAP